jgi:hypothetical protein
MAEARSISKVMPARIERAWQDRDAVWNLVRNSGPYPLMASLGGYEGFQLPTSPWFRAHWAVDGRALVPGAEALLANETFIEASKDIFSAGIVRPLFLTVNLMGPVQSGEGTHVDTPQFRGINRAKFPTWLLVMMSASNLFERWYVPAAGAVTWFYDGPGGSYDYWPDGLDGEMHSEGPPFGNVAVVADNDRMYHRISNVGLPEESLPAGSLPISAKLAASDDDGWLVLDENGHALHRYPAGKVRVSILWKAVALRDEQEAAVLDQHLDDLSVDQVVDVFSADLDARGIPFRRPADPFGDSGWQELLRKTYLTRPAA